MIRTLCVQITKEIAARYVNIIVNITGVCVKLYIYIKFLSIYITFLYYYFYFSLINKFFVK